MGSSAGLHSFLDAPTPHAIAHRGGSPDDTLAGSWPENTMRSFQAAVDLGFAFVETDVHLTADGMLVAFHDPTLDRATDGTGPISDLTWDQVRRVRVAGSEPIPLLEEILTTFPDLRVNIDPKADSAVEPLCAVLRRTRSLDRVCVGAFSDRRLALLRQLLGPDLCTSFGPRGVARMVAAARGVGSVPHTADCLQIPPKAGRMHLLTPGLLATARQEGIPVHVWTIDDPEEMARLLELGVDGIMTDRPATLRQVLEGRGEWHGADLP